MREYEQIGTVKVLRDKRSGEYACLVDFDVHAESRQGFSTIDGVMCAAAELVRDELHERNTQPALPPIDPRALVP